MYNILYKQYTHIYERNIYNYSLYYVKKKKKKFINIKITFLFLLF